MNPLKYWEIEGFETSTYMYSLKERINKVHKTSGSDNTGLCTYTYNELGFRGDSIHKDGFKIMSLGCSVTEGVGVNDYETWPSQFTKLIPNGVNCNFGTGGRSNDYIVRCLLTYFDLIKPDLVLIMYTQKTRREIYTKDNGIEPFMASGAWGYLQETEEGKQIQESMTILQNESNDIVNWYKNHLIIKFFLETKKCNWIWNGHYLNYEYQEQNRFDGGDYPIIDRAIDKAHPGPLTHKKYAKNLHEFISSNFPDYIPKNKNSLKMF